MLRSLTVRNLAVLAGGEVELGPGFNVLTGETGAGKSLIVDSLALLTGARAATDLVREGAETLTVVGTFDLDSALATALDAAGIASGADQEVVVRREIGREGRNRVFVNDRPATARLLQELSPRLLRIHGQREEVGLSDPELQRAWLDRAGGAPAVPLRESARRLWEAHRELAERLARRSGDERLRRECSDLLRFQAQELDEARLVEGEEEELRREREQLRHAEAIVHGLGSALARLSEDEGSAAEAVRTARHALAEIGAWEPVAAAQARELEEVAARLAEAGRELSQRLSRFEVEPGRLDAVEARLVQLERLLRKYGPDSGAALARRGEIARELAELEGGDEDREELERRTAEALAAYRERALELSAARRRWADDLERRVATELAELALAKARFAVTLDQAPHAGSPLVVAGTAVEFGPEGFDRVVFGLAANPGEPLLPLARFASGGELARVALAIQIASRGDAVDGGPAMVFDEIDAGLGGAQGAAVGRKLRRLARRGQILAVTHLPQVASFGDRQFRVEKRMRGGRTFAAVAPLAEAERVEEIARMLSADRVTAASRRHAAELLAAARESA